ncbi:DUF3600 domain-containing protein [Bacillus massiliigorillae]|uniref:DUF3600 domain-containing protein n=1 Tax=Bacillus massiliigorillae TaxID=1243664 RepID=UPI0003A8B5D2|nr:DUF3600 domain-containing protein [Bacillus massiliigorillae]
MSLENKLKQALQEKAHELRPPLQLKMQVLNPKARIRAKRKKRLLTGAFVTMLLIPTGGALAYQSSLADELYGSFENIKKHVASFTMESFLKLNGKLANAKGELGDEEYKEFTNHLKVFTSSKLEYGDKYGNIDYDQIPAKKAKELKQTLMILQPFFDRLNNQPSTKDILTPTEYDQYISAQMTYEKIKVKSEVNPNERHVIEDIKESLRLEFLKAEAIIDAVNEKQNQY